MAITDFKQWLDIVDLESADEVDELYNAVDGRCSCGFFDVKQQKGNPNGFLIHSNSSSEDLLVASDAARDALKSLIEERYCNGEPEHCWYSFQRAMEKDD